MGRLMPALGWWLGFGPQAGGSLGEREYFIAASIAKMKRQVLTILVVHGVSVSGGITLLLKLLCPETG
jgi:pheromone shutdown protein TraB